MKTKLEIERLAFTYSRWKSKREGYIAGYEQCQKDNANLLWRIADILTYDDKDEDEKIQEVLEFIQSLNKQG